MGCNVVFLKFLFVVFSSVMLNRAPSTGADITFLSTLNILCLNVGSPTHLSTFSTKIECLHQFYIHVNKCTYT